MKIAILTLVFNNYGTRLQSYALCKVLKRLGGEDASIKVVNMDTPWGSGARKSFVERFRKLAASFKRIRGAWFQTCGRIVQVGV